MLSADQPRIKGYPFEVALGKVRGVQGVVLADQVKSVDWRARKATRKGRASAESVEQTLARIQLLLG